MFSILRTFRAIQIHRHQPVAKLSISCRGKPINREDLFTYTNGHFLINEKHQLERRYVKFDIDALCDAASSSSSDGASSRITSIEKMEGGFSKAL
ncbi:hypothetical protein ASPWEDRAFT_744360 [Aspergillus wentii DTO 134E9]|uniref:Uncharacterized protein n=1 Tax=Aspergillus wentii DTO 134E9 TaxID=1073089 RepID=A0A1L9RE67_ASPWE|nr:uncharacterized protein ASPWEDRAFT_744360 [Aspergillus wentii DTO 134E9]OJJ33216.1 hypothetical protein ASPWEDRAFT_744360 [Aspergillus wentii DTO 134E9]